MRPTDRARRILRRAQVLLGLLAVAVAVPVGVIAGGTAAPPSASDTVHAELLEPSPAPELAVLREGTLTRARWTDPDGTTRTGLLHADAGLAEGEVITVAVDAAGRPVGPQLHLDAPSTTGLLAGFSTLVLCWGGLALLSAAWRTRLDALDDEHWAADWAQVEPVWSGRT